MCKTCCSLYCKSALARGKFNRMNFFVNDAEAEMRLEVERNIVTHSLRCVVHFFCVEDFTGIELYELQTDAASYQRFRIGLQIHSRLIQEALFCRAE